ncbi:MAG: aminotransferase class I/II-fold pyridoxal phosphate-dependent enzyme [Oscillospiraceae bacterium]|nr:aminotransferase class I/II-fold pyridoxal phosphate-dependent enzyme [Oscillospiraceae bacterium]
MIRFDSDYIESAHPRILERLQATQGEQSPGYGTDPHCKRAADLIRAVCEAPAAAVHFLVGGTQANATMIAAVLRPHQGVIAADTGHITTHETGAIEATGHKILALSNNEGKITARQIQELVDDHWAAGNHEHTVQPGMVYISFSTEVGTVYSLEELTAISQVCRERGLPLMLDGARMGYGLAAVGGDVTLSDIARLCDLFYIGGTKVGGLFGEAVVIPNAKFQQDFRYLMKRQGGLLAKGFLLGLQFECLFEDGLYFELGRHGVAEAIRLRQGIFDAGFSLRYDTGTNQLFPLLPDAVCQKLAESFVYCPWEKVDDTHSVIRLCTSWGTRPADVDALIEALKKA